MTPNLSINYLYSEAKLGDIVYLGVVMDTAGQEIVGVDVHLDLSTYLTVLNYLPTTLLATTVFNQLNWPIFTFSQLCDPGQKFMGKGLIAVLQCKTIKKGTASLKFKFSLGSTTDSNLASPTGKDILASVTNRKLKII